MEEHGKEENPNKQGQEQEHAKEESHKQEHVIEESPNKQAETNQDENETTPISEVNQLLDEKEEEVHENEAQISDKNQVLQTDSSREIQSESGKKTNQDSKQHVKTKPTMLQPPSLLATEKRTTRERRNSVDFSMPTEKRARERRASLDFKELQPKLSKSDSLSYKAQSSHKAGGTPDLRQKYSTKANSKPKVTSTENADKKVENKTKVEGKEVESRYLKVIPKKPHGEELESNELRKRNTFKASPLPSFYHKKDNPPKPEIKKRAVTLPKSPLVGQRSKAMPNDENNKREEKGKRVTKTMSSTAKETINKLLKGTRKAFTPTTSKDTLKVVVSTA